MLEVLSERVPEGRSTLGRASMMRIRMRGEERLEVLLDDLCALTNISSLMFRTQRDQCRHTEWFLSMNGKWLSSRLRRRYLDCLATHLRHWEYIRGKSFGDLHSRRSSLPHPTFPCTAPLFEELVASSEPPADRWQFAKHIQRRLQQQIVQKWTSVDCRDLEWNA